MKKFTGHTEPWGDFVDAKINAADRLRRQVEVLRPGRIAVGTACDPYQPVEKHFRITRRCLELLADDNRFEVSVTTKSCLADRDIDIFKKFRAFEIGFSITHINPQITMIFEPGAPSSERRLATLKLLNQNHIRTWIFIAPVLPGLTDGDSNLNQIFRAGQICGVSYLYFDTLNPYPRVWQNVLRLVQKHFPKLIPLYHQYGAHKKEYEHLLKEKINKYERYYKIKADFAFTC